MLETAKLLTSARPCRCDFNSSQLLDAFPERPPLSFLFKRLLSCLVPLGPQKSLGPPLSPIPLEGLHSRLTRRWSRSRQHSSVSVLPVSHWTGTDTSRIPLSSFAKQSHGLDSKPRLFHRPPTFQSRVRTSPSAHSAPLSLARDRFDDRPLTHQSRYCPHCITLPFSTF